jgi:hypothetical protein
MKIHRDPGYPVLFVGPYGEHRFGVTDGMEGDCWRILEFDPDDPYENHLHLVHMDYVVFDPEHYEEIYDPHADNLLEFAGWASLALPVMVAGCIAAWVGAYMLLIEWNSQGLIGLGLFVACFWWAYLLVEGGE